MYQIINNETGILIEETLNPQFLRQQPLRDFPICANNLSEADGVVLSDGNTMVGIAKEYAEGEPNMLNYTPLVRIVEVPDGAYVSGQIRTVQHQNENTASRLDAQQSLQLAGMQGQADQYTTTLAMQEQINAQQQLILANMQGLADVYTTLLSMQTPTGTEA